MPLYAEEWLLGLAIEMTGKPDAAILNIFCGMNKYGLRVDMNPAVKPDVVADAHELTKHVNGEFDIIFADPPYSTEEAREIYGTPPLKYKKWTSEAAKLLRVGGLLIVYHKYLMPNPNPQVFRCVKRVFIGNRSYHLPRVAVYYEKHG